MVDLPGRVVDADGHVLEPADTWLKYLEPSYRERAIRIAADDDGYEVLLIDGRPLKTLRGQLGALGGIEMDTRELLTRGQVSYAAGSPPGAYDPSARLRVMDGEGIDAVLLYPTIGICWEGHVTDGHLATAYTRAYNRWLAEFCRTDPRRLYPVAHISLLDPEGTTRLWLTRCRLSGKGGRDAHLTDGATHVGSRDSRRYGRGRQRRARAAGRRGHLGRAHPRGGKLTERRAREIDAGGLVVSPGFIDVHTHYDAQYTWDPYATSSIWHGITTTVIGNCGFAIAPCRPADRDLIMRTLVKVEGMSLAAMRTGITWGFETFPEYLDHLERCNPSLNVAALLGHSTIRQWVMGGDSQHRVATAEEVDAMCRLVREAMAAGAIGLGSSTAEAHVGENGLPVASRMADKAEFLALTRAMGESGRGLFQATIGSEMTMEDLREIWRTSGRPVIWAAFFQRDDRPEYVPERLAATEAFHREGVEVVPQVSCRPLTMDFTMKNPYPFEGMLAWRRVMAEPESRWLSVYGDPQFRAALKADLDARRFAVFRGRWDLVQVLRTSRPEHKALEGTSLADLAQQTGKHPVDAWLDLVTADGLDVEFLAGLLNTDDTVVGDLVAHPLTLITLSDAGAHLSLMCDAGYSSTLLGKWVRGLKRLSLEAAVKRLTDDPARAYRIPERGRLAPGYWADVVVFDPATIDALPAEWVSDLPAGEPRFVSRARGVEWSLVNGEPVLERGVVLERPAGARPGQVLRRFASR